MNKRGKLRSVVMFMAMFMMASVLFSCNDAKEKKNEKDEEKDKKEQSGKINSKFKEKIQQYNYLNSFSEGYAVVGKDVALPSGGVRVQYTFIDKKGNEIAPCQYDYAKKFSEGLAPVMKDGKWGYINTKGEVVIPLKYTDANCFSDGFAAVIKDTITCYINASGEEKIQMPTYFDNLFKLAGEFSEGMACIIEGNDYEWGTYSYYVIDNTGKRIFGGNVNGGWCTGEGGSFNEDYMPKFKDGEIYIPAEEYEMYDVYDKTGKKLRTDKAKAKTDEKYEIVSEITDTIGINFIMRNGLKEISSGKVVVPAIYDEFGKFEDGMALVCLYDYDKNPMTYGDWYETYYADHMRHWGYVDLDGNDTFSDEVKEKCAKSLEIVKSNMESYYSGVDPIWLKGTWCMDTYNGNIYMIFDNGKLTTYYQDYPDLVDIENYTIMEDFISIEYGYEEDCGDVMRRLDYSRCIVTIDGNDLRKVSNSTTIDPKLQRANAR